MSYRKREIGHWNQGKGYKGTRKAKERAYVRHDVEEQIAIDSDENFKYRHRSRTPNKIAQLQHWIAYYEQRVLEYERQAKHDPGHWRCAWTNYARDALRRHRKHLAELQIQLESKSVSKSK